MISPLRSSSGSVAMLPTKNRQSSASSSSSPVEESPTPAAGATTGLRLSDEDSPIRKLSGQSRNLSNNSQASERLSPVGRRMSAASPLKISTTIFDVGDDDLSSIPETPLLANCNSLPPPLFPVSKASASAADDEAQEHLISASRLPRLSLSQPSRTAPRPTLPQKKTVSLDQLPTPDKDETFGAPIPLSASTQSHMAQRRSRHGSAGPSTAHRHKRINSGEGTGFTVPSASISRSFAQKSLALSHSSAFGPLPDFASSSSSLSSTVSSTPTPPVTAFSPAEPPIFELLAYVPDDTITVTAIPKRYISKPRDSGVSFEEQKPALLGLGKPKRPPMLKRNSSYGDEPQQVHTPGVGPSLDSNWPGHAKLDGGQPTLAPKFDFLTDDESAKLEDARESREDVDDRPIMPDTPVKGRVLPPKQSLSNPSLAATSMLRPLTAIDANSALPPQPSFVAHSSKKAPTTVKRTSHFPSLTVTSESSPSSPLETESSPTVVARVRRMSVTNGVPVPVEPLPSRVGMLRRASSGVGSGEESGDEGTPTKGGGARAQLARQSYVKF